MKYLMVLSLCVITFSGCDFIGDVFKAGIWVGVIIVIAIITVIALIIKMFKS